MLDASRPPFAKWFVGGRINLCHNAVDRHLPARGQQPALIYVSTETGHSRTYTYAELHDEVNVCAAMLQGLGVRRGERVLIYMPMIAEAVFAMLACTRLGAIHSVVFGGFAAASLAALTIGTVAFVDTRERLTTLLTVVVAYTSVAVAWAAFEFVGADHRTWISFVLTSLSKRGFRNA